jgi:hypothetical protein
MRSSFAGRRTDCPAYLEIACQGLALEQYGACKARKADRKMTPYEAPRQPAKYYDNHLFLDFSDVLENRSGRRDQFCKRSWTLATWSFHPIRLRAVRKELMWLPRNFKTICGLRTVKRCSRAR